MSVQIEDMIEVFRNIRLQNVPTARSWLELYRAHQHCYERMNVKAACIEWQFELYSECHAGKVRKSKWCCALLTLHGGKADARKAI